MRVFQGKSFRAQSALKPECNGENNIAKQCHRVCDLEWDFRKLLFVTVQTHLKIRGVFRDNAKLWTLRSNVFCEKKVFER